MGELEHCLEPGPDVVSDGMFMRRTVRDSRG